MVARLCCPKETLSQITNLPIDLAPLAARPVGGSLRSVCVGLPTQLTFPVIRNHYHVLWVTHPVHVSILSEWR
jgi:hypothetical protein